MSENNKPLIFLEPLSQTLKKLKEVLEENSESEGIEIYDVESVEEASQLIPTIGQAVILTASPKTCAVTLQSNRRYIKKFQTKTLLLTPKPIPRKTLDKFMKVGLTECIVEPVNPKTLLYKVRLQLRSISAEKDEHDGEMQKKFGEETSTEAIDTLSKMRAEKGVILDEEPEERAQRDKKEVKEETLEDYSKPKKKMAQEETIDGFYRGKQKRQEVALEDEEDTQKKKGYQEEIIEGHYKGKLDKQEAQEDTPEAKRDKLELPIIEEDLESIKRQVTLEVEEDYNKKQRDQILESQEAEEKAKSPRLNIEEEEEANRDASNRESEDLGGHYKGNVNNNHLDIEDDEEEITQERDADHYENLKGKSSPTLNIEDDEQKEYLDKEEVPEDISPEKKSASLDIEEDDQDEITQSPKLNIIDEKEDKEIRREEDEQDSITKEKSTQLAIIDEHEEDDIGPKKVDDIDGYLRGGKARKNLDIDNDEDLYKDEKGEKEKERKRKQQASLDLYDDENQKDPLLGEKEYPENRGPEKKEALLNLYDDEPHSKDPASKKEGEGYERARSSYQEEETGGFGKGHSAHTQHSKDRYNKSNARADQIKTHYDSREGIKHNEGSWDSNWEKAGVAEQDFQASKKENEISYASEDLSEQTIDYAQLKKEFEGMDLGHTPKKKKDYGEFEQVAQVKTFTKTVLSPTGTLEAMEYEEIQALAADEEESHQVFLPDSKGIETVIEVLNFYQTDNIHQSAIYNYISMKLDHLFKGDLTLYLVDKKKDLELIHMGAVVSQLGIAPVKPKEEDALDKQEFKLLMKEFEEEDQEYRMQALALQNDWKDKWEGRLSQWQSCQTPKWRDHTFQEEDNEFIFPFYEGVSLLGLAIFTPKEDFVESKSGALEVALESLRAPILTEYHSVRGQGEQRAKTIIEPQAPTGAKGFFKKWFGKKAS